MTKSDDPERDALDKEFGGKSLAKEMGVDLVREARTWLIWALAGAALGAGALGFAGFWFFGWKGLWIGAGIGAVAGGFAAWLFYLQASTL